MTNDITVADPSTSDVIFFLAQPTTPDNHKGGWLDFWGDGYVLLALGDGGGAGDTFGKGQNRIRCCQS